MDLKNYQEDVVLGMIDILLEDEPDFQRDQQFKYDIAAYTLNRIPPKYFMSERGFTRFADLYLSDEESPGGFLNLVELSVVITNAIEMVKQRRQNNGSNKKSDQTHDSLSPEYYHNFPHIIGRVFDGRTNAPIFGANVTLMADGMPAATAGPGWPNPYTTSQPGKGYFTFWPHHVFHSRERMEHSLVVRIEHGLYEPCEIERTISTTGDFELKDIVSNEAIVNLDTCLLTPRGE